MAAATAEQNVKEVMGNLILQSIQFQTHVGQLTEQLAEVTADRDKLKAQLDNLPK